MGPVSSSSSGARVAVAQANAAAAAARADAADAKRQVAEANAANARLQAEFDKFLKENEQLKKDHQEMERKYAEAKMKYLSQGDVDKYEKAQEEHWEAFCKNVQGVKGVPRTAIPSIAVIGPSGVGKSTLINALVGSKVTKVGMKETTTDIVRVHETPTAEFWDVPGSNNERSYANLEHIMQMKQMHVIIIVYTHRIRHITKLAKLVEACKVPHIVVRSQMDVAEADEGKTLEQTIAGTKEAEKKLVKAPLLYVSAKTGDGVADLAGMIRKLGVSW